MGKKGPNMITFDDLQRIRISLNLPVWLNNKLGEISDIYNIPRGELMIRLIERAIECLGADDGLSDK